MSTQLRVPHCKTSIPSLSKRSWLTFTKRCRHHCTRTCRVIRWCFVPMHISRTPDDDGLPHSRKVGSLRIAAQHSVHPISGKVRRSHTGTARQCRCGGGSRRVFRLFSWLGVGSVKVALPLPTH